MSEPMMITQEMKDSREKAVSKIIDRINDNIKRAVERGKVVSKGYDFYCPLHDEDLYRFETVKGAKNGNFKNN